MKKTIVQMECVSKKESKSYNTEHPIATTMEFQIPYDQNSVFYQLSGGTLLTLNTINEDAAAMFVIGNKYELAITAVEN